MEIDSRTNTIGYRLGLVRKLVDQISYLESEEIDQKGISRAKSKIVSASQIIDKENSLKKLKEAEALLDISELVSDSF